MNVLTLLVPLETLPGWPVATAPTLLQALGLLIGIPALAAVVIAGLAKISAVISTNRYSQDQVPDSVWMGSRPPLNQPLPGNARSIDGPIEEVDPALPAEPEPEPVASGTGGASARW